MSYERSMKNPRLAQHDGGRIVFWYDPAEDVDEPLQKTVGRLKNKSKRPESYGPASNTVRAGDVRVDVKHWLGRMERQSGAH